MGVRAVGMGGSVHKTFYSAVDWLGEGFSYLVNGGVQAAAALIVSAVGIVLFILMVQQAFRWARWRSRTYEDWLVDRADWGTNQKAGYLHVSVAKEMFPDVDTLSIRALQKNGVLSPAARIAITRVDKNTVAPSSAKPQTIKLSPDVLSKLGLDDEAQGTLPRIVKLRIQPRVLPWNSPNREIYISFWVTAWVTLLTTVISILLEFFMPSYWQ